MSLIRTSILSSIAAVIKLLTLLGINKLLAIYVGPSGYAVLGQFQNAVQIISTFGSGALSTGVTKYTAEYTGDLFKQSRVWRTAGSITLLCSMFSATVIAFCREWLAGLILNDPGLGDLFLWLAAALLIIGFNSLLLAILNGRKEVSLYIQANIAGSMLSLLVVAAMIYVYGLYGALVSLTIYQSVSFFITLYLCYRTDWFRLAYVLGRVDKVIALDLGKYVVMAVTSALCVPLSLLLIRNYIISDFGVNEAGCWEALMRLSASYMILVTATLSTYYLPKLSELKTGIEIKAEIIHGYKFILPVAIFCGGMVFFLKKFIIDLLFSNDFFLMSDLFLWQTIGDVIKVVSWLLGYILTAQALTRAYIFSEVFFSISFVIFVVIFSKNFGFCGVSIAYAFNYFLHLLFMFFFLKYKSVF